jgi:O-antigen/teichoic acid export membrane protein
VAEMLPRLGTLFIVPIWSSRIVPAEYGKWIVIATTLEVLLGIGSFGISEFHTKVLFRYHDNRADKYFGLGGMVVMANTAILAILWVIASHWLRSITGWNLSSRLFSCLAAYLLLAQFNAMAIHYLQCTINYFRYTLQTLARWFINSSIFLTSLLVYKQGFFSWVWAAFGTESLIFMLSLYQLRHVEWTFWHKRMFKFALRMGYPMMATFFFGWAQNRAVRYALLMASFQSSLGLYGAAENFASNYGSVIRPGKIVAQRILGHTLEQDAESPDFMEFFHFFSTFAFVAAFVASLFLGGVLKLFTSSTYHTATHALPYLIFGLYLSEICTLYQSLMFRYFKVWFNFSVLAISLPVLVLSIVLLVPKWGLIGAAAAQFCGFTGMFVLSHVYASRVTQRDYRFGEKMAFTFMGLAIAVAIDRMGLSLVVRAIAAVFCLGAYIMFYWKRRDAICPKIIQMATAFAH